jgi:hypothetical protein
MSAPACKSIERYTEAELLEFEHAASGDKSSIIRELTRYIRETVGTEPIPPFKPFSPQSHELWEALDNRRREDKERRRADEERRWAEKAIAALDHPGDIPMWRKR